MEFAGRIIFGIVEIALAVLVVAAAFFAVGLIGALLVYH